MEEAMWPEGLIQQEKIMADMMLWPREYNFRRRVSWLFASIITSAFAFFTGSWAGSEPNPVFAFTVLVSVAGFLGMNAIVYDVMRFSIVNSGGIEPVVRMLEDTWYTSLVFAFLLLGVLATVAGFSSWYVCLGILAIAITPVALVVYKIIADFRHMIDYTMKCDPRE